MNCRDKLFSFKAKISFSVIVWSPSQLFLGSSCNAPGEERWATSLKTAAKETSHSRNLSFGIFPLTHTVTATVDFLKHF